MSFYVHRQATLTDPEELQPRPGWTGPIRSPAQADREADAWRSAGWAATVEPSTPQVRAQVRAWERSKRPPTAKGNAR